MGVGLTFSLVDDVFRRGVTRIWKERGRDQRETPIFFQLMPRLPINIPHLLISSVKLISLHVKNCYT